ncbi:hypothetical protein PsorP6_008514 [Peronosclerospora sorghi]|uniref:Uncharacterized protein n=1 Tax=Peronosclerospora sorghi TaxID=230839 RepID=A0ACC0W855_9STRA|nr:hypothetical protein PsorP6_008514 [Peronosclerospora sorghi]
MKRTKSVAADEAGATTKPDKLSVTTQSVGTSHVSVAIAIGAVVAIAAVLVVIMVSAMYAKSRRNLFDECKTRVDAFLCGKLSTPPTGRGCTPREGSLVLVVSQSSFATI